jgi:hypothetical protein
MRIVTVKFDYGDGEFNDLLKAFEASCAENCPVPVEVVSLPPPEITVRKGYNSNTDKLEVWNEWAQNADEDIIFMDCDMLVLGDMSDGFNDVEDIGFTYRDYYKGYPFNSGVVYMRNTDYAKHFFQRWTEYNRMMLDDPELHRKYKKIYGGINQSANGKLIHEENITHCKLPMSVYNLCEDWSNWEKAKAIHFKGVLRREVSTMKTPLVQLWKYYRKLADELVY